MKKTISLIVAFAMILVMGVSAFAAEKPTDVPADAAALGAYYAELLNADDADVAAIAAEIVTDFQNGLITTDTIGDVVAAILENADDVMAAQELISQVFAGLGDLGVTVPSTTELSTDDGSITLPTDGEDSGEDSFLNSILGILGSIGDMIFGGGAGGNEESTTDPVFSDTTTTQNNGDSVPDTGDTAVASITAVALVAGVAFALTRKKSDDAE